MLTKKKMFGKLYEKIFTIKEENDLCWVAKKETVGRMCSKLDITECRQKCAGKGKRYSEGGCVYFEELVIEKNKGEGVR